LKRGGLIVSVGTGVPGTTLASPNSILEWGKQAVDLVTCSETIAKNVEQTLSLMDFQGVYVRLNPTAVGNVSLDTVDEKILNAGIAHTNQYLNGVEAVRKLDKIVKYMAL
jgi:hypothetical protein